MSVRLAPELSEEGLNGDGCLTAMTWAQPVIQRQAAGMKAQAAKRLRRVRQLSWVADVMSLWVQVLVFIRLSFVNFSFSGVFFRRHVLLGKVRNPVAEFFANLAPALDRRGAVKGMV
jgi:hypothetical protein